MWAVLLHCGLLQYRGGSGHSPLMNAWEYFIVEQQLDEVEVTHFIINKKRRYFIRLGSADQVELFIGISDMLEDDLEHLRQQSKKISNRTS